MACRGAPARRGRAWPPPPPARNRLLSLALRPAPATDAWRAEGPALTGLAEACAGVTLVQAPSPGAEAAAIALGLRAALEDGARAALITPDRLLSRQVAAQLDRWGIEPDDSAGRPPAPVGARAPAAAGGGGPWARGSTRSGWPSCWPIRRRGATTRGAHLARARRLEIGLLRGGPCPFPDRDAVMAWAARGATEGASTRAASEVGTRDDAPEDGAQDGAPEVRAADAAWAAWLADLIDALAARAPTARRSPTTSPPTST